MTMIEYLDLPVRKSDPTADNVFKFQTHERKFSAVVRVGKANRIVEIAQT